MKKRLYLLGVLVLILAMVLGLSACNGASGDDGGGDGEGEGTFMAGEPAGSEAGDPDGEAQSAVVEAIANTYSAKDFVAGEVTKAQIAAILESGAKAPSARNSQLWHFTVVKDSGSELVPANGAVAIVISGSSEEQEGINVDFDTALATENMYLAAQSLGLGAHIYQAPIRNINETMRDSLEIPDGYDAIALLVVGHVQSIADGISGASARNPLSDMVNYIE